MFARLRMAFAVVTAVCLAACQPAGPTGPLTPAGGATAGGATIAVRIVTEGGMGVKALPKTAADVKSFKIELVSAGPNGTGPDDDDEVIYTTTVDADTYTNPHSIPNVGEGAYYLMVDAFDDKGESISQPHTRYSVNGVQVTGGTAAYIPGGTELIVNLKLLNGTEGKGSASVTMTPPAHFGPAHYYGVSLVNQMFGDVVSHVGLAQQMTLSKIQEGTFEIWSNVANYQNQVTTPAKPMVTNITVSSEGATTPNVMSWGYSAAGFHTDNPGDTFTTDGTMITGSDGATYYTEGADIKKVGDPSFHIACANTPTAMAVGPDGTLYYVEDFDIKDQNGNVLHTANAVVTALAIDPNGDVYYVEDKTLRRVGTPVLGPQANNPVWEMAIDRSHNVYFIDNSTVRMYVARTGFYFGQLWQAGSVQTVNSFSGDVLAGIAVDLAGNLYIANKTKHAIAMIAAGNPGALRVAGTTVAGTDDSAADALTAKITAPIGMAVSNTGTLYFTSSNGTEYVVRRVE